MNKYNYQYSFDEKRWIKLNQFPKSVGSVRGIFEIKNTYYVVGVKGISTLKNEFYKFPSNNKYNCCATCRVGNNILVVCIDYDDNDLKSSLFNPINKEWSDANITIKRNSFTAAYYFNKVWIIGGSESNGRKWKLSNTVEVYNPVTKNQILSPIKINIGRRNHRVIVYKNKLFVFGGYDEDHKPLNSVEMFSPEDHKFVMMTPMRIARYSFACCRVGKLVYVIGGMSPSSISTRFAVVPTISVEIYDMDTDTWTDGVDFPVAEEFLFAFVVNNKLPQ